MTNRHLCSYCFAGQLALCIARVFLVEFVYFCSSSIRGKRRRDHPEGGRRRACNDLTVPPPIGFYKQQSSRRSLTVDQLSLQNICLSCNSFELCNRTRYDVCPLRLSATDGLTLLRLSVYMQPASEQFTLHIRRVSPLRLLPLHLSITSHPNAIPLLDGDQEIARR